MFTILYFDQVVREDIPALPSVIAGRVRLAIETKLTGDPIKFGKPLQHSWRGHRRLRVGKYRIIYRIAQIEKTVTIVKIDKRDDVY